MGGDFVTVSQAANWDACVPHHCSWDWVPNGLPTQLPANVPGGWQMMALAAGFPPRLSIAALGE